MINECNVCGCPMLKEKKRVFIKFERNEQSAEEEYAVNCIGCGNLVYGYSRPYVKN